MNIYFHIKRWRVLYAVIGACGLIVAIWWFSHTITFLDRTYFLSDKRETIDVVYISWMCNHPNFVETKEFKTDPITETDGDDFFFIEPAIPGLVPWDSIYKYRDVRLTGQFYIDEGIPEAFAMGHIEEKPVHARVFKYEKIEY